MWGGTLVSGLNCAYAADVQEQTVTIDDTTSPLPDPIAAGAISSAADGGNVFKNTLTINGWHRNVLTKAYGGYTIGTGDVKKNRIIFTGSTEFTGNGVHEFYGGYAGGTGSAQENTATLSGVKGKFNTYGGYAAKGDATKNTVIVDKDVSFVASSQNCEIYGGYAALGKATDNTVILRGGSTMKSTTYVHYTLRSHLDVYGGKGGIGKDATTGNILQVENYENVVRKIDRFEKLRFTLKPDALGSGTENDRMLYLTDQGDVTFKWSDIQVEGAQAWFDAQQNRNVKFPDPYLLMREYNGHYLKIKDYKPKLLCVSADGNYELGLQADVLPNELLSPTAKAGKIQLTTHQFQNVNKTVSEGTANVVGGTSYYGSTVKNNRVTIDGGNRPYVEGGWVKGFKGSAEYNTVIQNAGSTEEIRGGVTMSREANDGACHNTVIVNGGTVNRIYGGYLDLNENVASGMEKVAGGDASWNTIELRGGKFMNTGNKIVGGWGAKRKGNTTGSATHNTIIFGKDDGTFDGDPDFRKASVWGGDEGKDTRTGNHLKVKAVGFRVGWVNDFEHYTFYLKPEVMPAYSTFLTVGSASKITWENVNVNMPDGSFTPSTYDKSVYTLMKTAGGGTDIELNVKGVDTYAAVGARHQTVKGDFEWALDTDTHSGSASKIHIEGYRFQNHTGDSAHYKATYGEHKEAWAGRTAQGNKVQKNVLTVEGGTITEGAHGGLVENYKRVGGTLQTTGDADDNTLRIEGDADVKNGYGAKVQTKDGSATNNKVFSSTTKTIGGALYGGALTADGATGSLSGNRVTLEKGDVSGDVYGGYIKHNLATGNATNNHVTLCGNVGGNVYGGYTAGSGTTTQNTVTIGTDNQATNLAVTGTIYGGSAADDTGNILNVKANATAKNIEHFEKIKFTLHDEVDTSAPMLELNGTSATAALDWNKIDVDTKALNGSSVKSYEAYTQTLLKNSSNLNFTGVTGSRNLPQDGNSKFEFALRTNTSGAVAQEILVTGYQFKDHMDATYTASDGNHNAAWAGRTESGNTVKHNKLTVKGGTLNGVNGGAYGGLVENKKAGGTTGDAEDNTLAIEGGNITKAFGAEVRTKDGSATGNKVEITGGTIDDVSGAALTAAGATGNASNNTVKIAGGTINGVVGGALIDGGSTGNATNNTVTVEGGSVTGDLYGGFTNGSGKTTGNTINLGNGTDALKSGTTLSGTLYGGNKDAEGNILNVKAKAEAGNIKNFEHIDFNLNSSIMPVGSTVLKLTDGAKTKDLDWEKLNVNPKAFTGAGTKSYEALGYTLLENAAGLDFKKGSTDTYAQKGARGETNGNLEYVVDTDTHSFDAKKVTLSGYQFKDNTAATYKATDGAHDKAWGGRSIIGNRVENNTLTVDGGTLNKGAYGGLVENNKRDASGNKLTTGDAVKNNLVLKTGANTANAFGAEVRTKDGKAEENTVTMEGGTVNGKLAGGTLAAENAKGNATKNRVTIKDGTVTGDLYGGSIEKATATGNAANNTVTITGGSVSGDIYGGFTAGTGKTTGNKVTLGDGTGPLAAAINGTLYGGSDNNDVTDNTLEVNDNATAKNIKNFDTIAFHLNNNNNASAAMLTLNGGAVTDGLDWKKLTVDPMHLNGVGTKSYEAFSRTLIENANGLKFDKGGSDTYDKVGARSEQTTTHEYVIDTDNHTGNANKVILSGYQFKDNTAATYKATDGAHDEAWGGHSIIGNRVENNTLTVDGGTLNKGAYGGLVENNKRDASGNKLTTGDAVKNTLVLKAGAHTANAFGAEVRTKDGSATENTVTMEGGTVTNNLYGAALTDANATGNATNNTVTLKGGTINGDLYGGFTRGAGKTTGNTVKLGDGSGPISATVGGTIYGGSGADTTGNTLNVNDKGVTAGSVQGFSTIRFKLGSSVENGDTVLKLTEDTTIDYNTIIRPEVDNWLGDQMERTAHLIGMEGGKTLTLNGYVSGIGIKRGGDVEYALKTDTDTMTTMGSLDLNAYKWQHANVIVDKALANVFGGKALYAPNGETQNNKLTLNNGADVTTAIGGDTQTENGFSKKNLLTINEGANVHDKAIGGKAKKGDVIENTAKMQGGTVTGGILGGESTAGDAKGNCVDIDGGTVNAGIIGGKAAGAAENNTVILKSAVQGDITGGLSSNANATGNIITAASTVTGNITGGRAAHGEASKNILTLHGANITGSVTGGVGTVTNDNIIDIKNTTIDGTLTGGTNANGSGNTLNVRFGASTVGDFTGIQNLYFYLESGASNTSSTLLNVRAANKDIRTLKVGVGISGSAPSLQVNDIISLMKVGSTLTMDDTMENHVEGLQGVSLLYDLELKKRNANELVATIKKAAINEKTKSFVEPRNGGTSFINQGADIIANLDLRQENGDKDGEDYRLWAVLNHGNLRQETGSYVNTHGWNLAVGWAREDAREGQKTIFSPFVEYGRANYSAHLDDDTYGSGKLSYFGGGLIGHWEKNGGLWAESAIHGGAARSDYDGSITPSIRSTYSANNPYFAAHVGVGKDVTMKNGDKMTPYLKYFWSHQNGMRTRLNTGEEYDFTSVDSHRVRVGAQYRSGKDEAEAREFFVGLAFEYEFGGEARATYQGFDTPSTSARGASAMLELGYRFTPKKGRLSYDFRLTGWQGKRRGFMGSVQATWAF